MIRNAHAGQNTIAAEGAGRGEARDWKRRLRPFVSNKLVLIGAFLVVVMIGLAIAAPWLIPYDPIVMDVSMVSQGPSASHWLGTDQFGRDILSRLIYGSRISLFIGLTSVIATTLIGTLIGLAGGYFGGWIDHATSRVMDVLFSVPSLLLAIVIAAVLGAGINNAILAIVIVYVPLFSRVARGSALSERHRDYVEAARVAGGGEARILLRHVLPNMVSPLTIQASITVSWAILVESYLSYLGLGTAPPTPSWGAMLNEGQSFLEAAPWISLFPGLAIMVAVLAFNLLGDGIRDVLDPRSR